MRNIIIIGLIALGLYFFYPQDHSSSSIASGIQFDGHTITYNDESFVTQWSSSESIYGYVRSVNKAKSKIMPIITTVIAITTGDYSDPEKTRFDYSRNGYLIYNLNPSKKINGTVTVYNLIPSSESIQKELDDIQIGNTVSLNAKFSTTGTLKGEQAEVRLSAFAPNQYVRNKMTKSEDPNTKQYIAFVESV